MVFALVGFDAAVTQTFTLLRAFINTDSMVAAEAIFGTIMVYHALVGAAELVSGQESRLVQGSFYVRILFVAFLVYFFDKLFVTFGESLCRGCLDEIFTIWNNIWVNWADMSNEMYAKGLKDQATSAGGLNLANMLGSLLFETLISGLGLVIALIIGGLTMLYLIFQSFVALGSVSCVLALGPIALPFAAHESTQDIALAYAKTFLVYVVLYMPMLVFAFQVAMTIMASVCQMTSGLAYGGIGDALEHVIGVVAAPFAGAAIVAAVPHVVKGALK